MVYVWCYGNKFKFFKLRKEEKRGRKRRNLLDLPAPESEVFFLRSAGSVSRERKKDKKSS
jgi:hypothetical protein